MQIEHLENHLARLTVDVDQERLDKAKQAASRRIAGQVNIPGFRKGKAPYAVVLRYVGEQAILEEAIDKLGNEVFREALVESKIEPYAPGDLEKVETEPNLKLVFTVPMQPTVSLENYREVRFPYIAPVVEDKAVDETLARMLDARALVEAAVERPAQLGDLVKMKLHGTVIHPAHEHVHDEDEDEEGEEGEAPAAQAEAESEAAAEAPAAAEASAVTAGEPAHTHADEDDADEDDEPEEFIDREVELVMYGDDERDFVPGFTEQIIGLKAGDEKEFTISVPDDHPQSQYASHTYTFKATVQEVKPRILPAMNDDFARAASEGKVDNLLDLRILVRNDLQEHALEETNSEYADKVLAQIVEGAKVEFPQAMVDDYVDSLLQSLDERLRRNGLTLNQLMTVQNKTPESLRDDYREAAISRIKRDVVVNELLGVEKLRVADADVDQRVEEISSRFSDDPAQIDSFRKMLDRPESRNEIAYELAMSRMRERLVAIGKGENPPIPADAEAAPAEAAVEAPAIDAESAPPQAQAEAPVETVQSVGGAAQDSAQEQPPAEAPDPDSGPNA